MAWRGQCRQLSLKCHAIDLVSILILLFAWCGEEGCDGKICCVMGTKHLGELSARRGDHQLGKVLPCITNSSWRSYNRRQSLLCLFVFLLIKNGRELPAVGGVWSAFSGGGSALVTHRPATFLLQWYVNQYFGFLASWFQGVSAFGPWCYQPRDLFSMRRKALEVFVCLSSFAG